MTDVTQQLDELRQLIQYNLAVRGLDATLKVVDDDGEHPVVVALGEERLAVLLGRVEAVGGYANVFVAEGDVVSYVAVLSAAGALAPEAAEDLTGEERPAESVTVGMFLSYLRTKPHGVRLPRSLRAGPRPLAVPPSPVELATAS